MNSKSRAAFFLRPLFYQQSGIVPRDLFLPFAGTNDRLLLGHDLRRRLNVPAEQAVCSVASLKQAVVIFLRKVFQVQIAGILVSGFAERMGRQRPSQPVFCLNT